MDQYLYVLSNPSMPGLVKIGWTSRSPEERAKELFQGVTGVPVPFEVQVAISVEDGLKAERITFEALARYREFEGREFFRIDAAEAADVIFRVVKNFLIVIDKVNAGRREQERIEREREAERLRQRAARDRLIESIRSDLASRERLLFQNKRTQQEIRQRVESAKRKLYLKRNEFKILGGRPPPPKSSLLDTISGRSALEKAGHSQLIRRWDTLEAEISDLEGGLIGLDRSLKELQDVEKGITAGIAECREKLSSMGVSVDISGISTHGDSSTKARTKTELATVESWLKRPKQLRYCVYCKTEREARDDGVGGSRCAGCRKPF